MKYLYSIFIYFSILPFSAFAQENTNNEFYSNDPSIYKKEQLLIPAPRIKNILFVDGIALVSIKDTLTKPAKTRIGIINSKGKFLAAPKYLKSEKSEYGIIALLNEENGWEFFDPRSGVIETSGKVDDYKIFSGSQILFANQGRWGMVVLNKRQNHLIDPVYKSIEKINGDNFKFTHFNNWVLVDTSKKILNSYLYDSLSFFGDSLLKYKLNEFSGLINYNGKTIKDKIVVKQTVAMPQTPNFDRSELARRIDMGQELKSKNKSRKNVIADSTGKTIAIEYDSILGPYANVYVLYNDKKIGIVDDKGLMLSEFSNRYDRVFPFKEERARILKNGKFGFIDLRGNIRVAPQYIKVRDFQEGLAAVLINGKWGFIDKDENIIVQPLYNEVADFKGGIARVKNNDKWYFVNKNDKKLGSGYDSIEGGTSKNWLLFNGSKKGLADVTGRELLAPRYELVKDLENGKVIVKKASKWGVVDYQENFVFPIDHDYASYNNNLFLFMNNGKSEERILKSDLQK
jgi:hypothetical protein